MSIETYFLSETGGIHRMNPSVQAGKNMVIRDYSIGDEYMIYSECGAEGKEALIIEVPADETTVDKKIVDVNKETLEQAGKIVLQQGGSYKRPVTLKDGSRGLLFMQHYDPETAKYN